MATADQLKALIKTHSEGDDARFYAVAMQVAAQAARQGHANLAQELKSTIDHAKERPPSTHGRPTLVAITKEMSDALAVGHPQLRLSDMVLQDETRVRIERVLHENRQKAKLKSYNLTPRRKILLIGPPGSGKTMTAGALAGELHLPLFTVRLEGLITKYLGETAARLRLVFETMCRTPGIYFFDEFDSIGGQRASSHDVGEARRILASFLQLLEEDDSEGLIVAATNHVSLLDTALFRRFDDVIEYSSPDVKVIEKLIKNRLANFPATHLCWPEILQTATGLSCAEITAACEDAAKTMVLSNLLELKTEQLMQALSDRKAARR